MINDIKLPTIITTFYDINNIKRGKNVYLELANKFILKLPYNLIIFTDDDEVISYINTVRSKYNYSDNTYIYNLPFVDTYFYKYKETIEILQTKYTIINGHLDHETPLYIILNNNKFDFVDRSILLNPFNSTHFIWMDFGINHVARNTEKIHEWILNIPDKIKQLCINPFIELGEYKHIFQYIYHHTAGGLFSGSANNMQKYSYLFKILIDKIYNEGWYQIDEAIMTIVQRENPELFDLYYGDYQGIISNYLEPINNIDLIMTMINKAYKYNNLNLMFKICKYLIPYFKLNINSNYIYDFLTYNIICNYYCNEKLLLIDIIYLINMKIIELTDNNTTNYININNTNNKIIEILNKNMNSINLYLNKKFIIKHEL